MNSRNLLLLLILPLMALQAGAVNKYNNEADHAMVVTISTDPQGAEVYALPATTNGEPVLLGKTPYITVVDFDWRKGWFSKRWGRLQVTTPGDICRAEYTSKGGHYDVYMTYKIEAPGYETFHKDELIASFSKPKDFDYDDIDFISPRKLIEYQLTPTASAQAASAAAAEAEKQQKPAVVVTATGDGASELGTVHVSVNVDEASVLVDGKPAGRAPVKLVLASGHHDVEVHKPGYQSYSNSLSVKAHSEVALKVTLAEALVP